MAGEKSWVRAGKCIITLRRQALLTSVNCLSFETSNQKNATKHPLCCVPVGFEIPTTGLRHAAFRPPLGLLARVAERRPNMRALSRDYRPFRVQRDSGTYTVATKLLLRAADSTQSGVIRQPQKATPIDPHALQRRHAQPRELPVLHFDHKGKFVPVVNVTTYCFWCRYFSVRSGTWAYTYSTSDPTVMIPSVTIGALGSPFSPNPLSKA